VLGVVTSSLLLAPPATAQVPAATTVPRVVRFDGVTVAPPDGVATPATVTLSLFDAPTGGTLLWEETQAVTIDAQGRYTVHLGAASPEGLPPAVLAGDGVRWLQVQSAGAPPLARTPLTSVPYALRASDAETLGGLPVSAFLRVPAGGASTTPAGNGGAQDDVRTAPPLVNTGTANFIGKFTNSIDLTSSVMFEASGRIGIGTGAVTPLDVVHARFTDATGGLTGLAVQNMSNGANAFSGTLFYDHTGALRQFQGYNNSTGEYRINNLAVSGSINFMQNNASRFRVRSDGDVEIPRQLLVGGTTSFGGMLDVASGTTPNAVFRSAHSFGNVSPILQFQRARNTQASPQPVQSGDTLGAVQFDGRDPTTFHLGAWMLAQAAETWTSTAHGTTVTFEAVPVGSTNRSQVMRFDAEGDVVIGGFSSASDQLHVAGEARVSNCVKNGGGSAIAGSCPSDARYKRDVRSFASSLDKVVALRPVTYFWRAEAFPEKAFGDSQTYGLIAQEAEAVLPELVSTDDQGYKSVDYSRLPLLAIQALKELKARNDDLERRLAVLEAALARGSAPK
jgi:hypothetical protein